MNDYSGRAELFLDYLISCDINSTIFNLKFIKLGSLFGEVKFQNNATTESFAGKFVINYELNSNRVIIVILMADAVFERKKEYRFLPPGMFMADTEDFYRNLTA